MTSIETFLILHARSLNDGIHISFNSASLQRIVRISRGNQSPGLQFIECTMSHELGLLERLAGVIDLGGFASSASIH